jgi:hypothetical protein
MDQLEVELNPPEEAPVPEEEQPIFPETPEELQ